MLMDLFHLADQGRADVQIFNANSTVAGNSWQQWKKPKGVSNVFLLAIGGAGGGGNGFTRTHDTAGAGGGGGAPGNISRLLVPAMFVPDILYLSIGLGGAATANGIATNISIAPSNTSGLMFLLANAGGTGATGTGAGSGGGGSAGSAVTAVGMALAGVPAFIQAANGANGGAATGALGATVTQSNSVFITTGGAGGAGCTSTTEFAGGASNPLSTTFYGGIAGGLAAASPGAAGGNGNPGVQLPGLFAFLGGSGGGSSNSGVAGNGGNGATGAGGGGGGAGATGGAGGRGGDGIGVVISW